MDNVIVSVIKNDAITQVNFKDLLQHKRVLVCSICRWTHALQVSYLKYLNNLKLTNQNLDDIIIVDSFYGKFGLLRLRDLCGTMTPVLDPGSLVEFFAKHMNKTQDIQFLSKFWSYQVLIENGNIKKFYQQPTADYKKEILDHFGHNANLLDPWLNKDESLVFERLDLASGLEQTFDIGRQLFYYKLWPNLELEDYIK